MANLNNSQRAQISVITNYIEAQSNPNANLFVFSYTITIKNISNSEIQLMSRRWLIKDANGKHEEVYGDGVIGKQPIIIPNQEYTYTSGAVLETEIGTMEGQYFMRTFQNTEHPIDNGEQFEAPIPPFILSIPRTLH